MFPKSTYHLVDARPEGTENKHLGSPNTSCTAADLTSRQGLTPWSWMLRPSAAPRLLRPHRKPDTSGTAHKLPASFSCNHLRSFVAMYDYSLAISHKKAPSSLRYPVPPQKCLLKVDRLLLDLGRQSRVTGTLHDPVRCRP